MGVTITNALLAKIGVDLSQFQKGMRNASKIADRVKDRIARTFKQVSLVVAAAGAAALAFGAKFTKSVISAASQSEGFRVRLNALLGSVEEGQRAFDEMADFASRVPFEYQEIMSAATSLSGVLKGGVDEIKEVMPIIADLAAVSGLSIEETTGQIIRSFSAGIGAADLFRERGISAMLGFQQGVTYSAEETRDRIIAAFNDADSNFRGASESLASTWDGLMSMVSDRWFQFRNMVADAGIFDVAKRAVGTFLDKLTEMAESGALAEIAQKASDTIIGVTRSLLEIVVKGVAAIETIGVEVAMFWEATLPAAVKTGVAKIQSTIADLLSDTEKIGGEEGTLRTILDWIPHVAIAEKLGAAIGEATAGAWEEGLRSKAAANEKAAKELVENFGVAATEQLAELEAKLKARMSFLDDIFTPVAAGVPVLEEAFDKFGNTLSDFGDMVPEVSERFKDLGDNVIGGAKRLKDYRKVLKLTQQPLEELREHLLEIAAAHKVGAISAAEATAATLAAQQAFADAMEKMKEPLEDFKKDARDIATAAGMGIVQGIIDGIFSKEQSLLDALTKVFLRIIEDLIMTLIRRGVVDRLGDAILGGTGGQVSFGPGGVGVGIGSRGSPIGGYPSGTVAPGTYQPSSLVASPASSSTVISGATFTLSFPGVTDMQGLKRELPKILSDLRYKGRIN